MAGKIFCKCLLAGALFVATTTGRAALAWTEEPVSAAPAPVPGPGHAVIQQAVPYQTFESDRTGDVKSTTGDGGFKTLYNIKMDEKQTFSMGVMGREEEPYIQQDKPAGIILFRYRKKF